MLKLAALKSSASTDCDNKRGLCIPPLHYKAMTEYTFGNYDDTDVTEAVEAVTGDTAVYTSIDDEHWLWFIRDSEDGSLSYESPNAECLEDLYLGEELDKIQAYLEANCEER